MAPLTKKRKKVSRHRGSHTHGRGFKKKARGMGHRGGIGMAGSGKKADQKKTLILKKFGNKYFGKSLSTAKRKNKIINLQRFSENIESFVKEGFVKENKGTYEANFEEYKIIGKLPSKIKLEIMAKGASKSAIDSVEKAGGKLILKIREKSPE